jgi:hypothetical protein
MPNPHLNLLKIILLIKINLNENKNLKEPLSNIFKKIKLLNF